MDSILLRSCATTDSAMASEFSGMESGSSCRCWAICSFICCKMEAYSSFICWLSASNQASSFFLLVSLEVVVLELPLPLLSSSFFFLRLDKISSKVGMADQTLSNRVVGCCCSSFSMTEPSSTRSGCTILLLLLLLLVTHLRIRSRFRALSCCCGEGGACWPERLVKNSYKLSYAFCSSASLFSEDDDDDDDSIIEGNDGCLLPCLCC
mmetsp:Transcript_4794/g.11373  ORF Transcript_4794/g.11373 Transcript_4794/m.11373 type:complete len:208 (-) Transcript_4794:273-896(-)